MAWRLRGISSPQTRIFSSANVDGDGAAWMKATPARDLDGVRCLATQNLRGAAHARVTARDDGQQRLRVRMLRIPDDVTGGALLHDPA